MRASSVSSEDVESPSGYSWVKEVLFVLGVVILTAFLVKTFLVRTFYIPSESMEDTLQINDKVVVNLLAPRFMELHRGDIVVFTDPGGWLGSEKRATPDASGVASRIAGVVLNVVGVGGTDTTSHIIKRVIGLPGDHVVCCDVFGNLTVNGTALEEPYTKLPNNTPQESPKKFDVTVPEGMLWVMGDNRYSSADSSYHHQNDPEHQYVPVDNVTGRAVVVSWPSSRWSRIDDYGSVFEGTDPK